MNNRSRGATGAGRLKTVIAATAWSLAFGSRAGAVQHLVSPGQNWQALAAKLEPGDEVILMPGVHRPASFSDLRGTINQPITIRGLDRAHPAAITAEQYGLEFHRAQHIILQDLSITGASQGGLVFDDAGRGDPPSSGFTDQIVIRRVSITRTGPRGERHAMRLVGMRGVFIDGCRIEGWGGSGIEIVGCRGLELENSVFRGLEDHTQACGVRIRAGSSEIRIDRCRFLSAGATAISLGSVSRIDDFRPPLPREATAGSVFEAARVQVSRCIIMGGQCAVVFVSSDDCLLRNNTILRPSHYVLWLAGSVSDVRLGRTRRGLLGDNLIAWEPGQLEHLVRVDHGADAASFVLEENLWWSGDLAERRHQLGPLPGESAFPQLTTVDPRLDENARPAEAAATRFGAYAD